MTSRYTYMKSSNIKDIDDDTWPDPLSVNYADVQFSEIPSAVKLSQADLDKMWLFFYKQYGFNDLDDIYLNINAVPHIGTLNPGDILCNVAERDIRNFTNQKLVESEDYL